MKPLCAVLLALSTLCCSLPSWSESKAEETLAPANYIPIGATQRCVSLSQLDKIEIIDNHHLLFRVGLNQLYLNTLPRPCRALGKDSALLIETRSSRLCDIDWVRIMRPFAARAGRVRGPACGLGVFQRVERVSPHTALSEPP